MNISKMRKQLLRELKEKDIDDDFNFPDISVKEEPSESGPYHCIYKLTYGDMRLNFGLTSIEQIYDEVRRLDIERVEKVITRIYASPIEEYLERNTSETYSFRCFYDFNEDIFQLEVTMNSDDTDGIVDIYLLSTDKVDEAEEKLGCIPPCTKMFILKKFIIGKDL